MNHWRLLCCDMARVSCYCKVQKARSSCTRWLDAHQQISRRKHVTPILFLISSDICSRLLGRFLLNWCCHGSTYYLYRKYVKVSGEGAPQASNISNAEIEAANRSGQIWYFQMMSNSCITVINYFQFYLNPSESSHLPTTSIDGYEKQFYIYISLYLLYRE